MGITAGSQRRSPIVPMAQKPRSAECAGAHALSCSVNRPADYRYSVYYKIITEPSRGKIVNVIDDAVAAPA